MGPKDKFPPAVAREIVRRLKDVTDGECPLCGGGGSVTSTKGEIQHRHCRRCDRNYRARKK